MPNPAWDLFTADRKMLELILKEKIMNLYDLLLQAQEENKPVEKIIGNNLEAFCKEYFAPIEEAKKKWYVFLTEGLYRIFKAFNITGVRGYFFVYTLNL